MRYSERTICGSRPLPKRTVDEIECLGTPTLPHPHDREELRSRDAHVRLGFADEAMLRHLDDAGLAGRVVELADDAIGVMAFLRVRCGDRDKRHRDRKDELGDLTHGLFS